MDTNTGEKQVITTGVKEEAWAIASTLISEQINYQVEAEDDQWTFRFVGSDMSRRARDFLTRLKER